MLKMLFLKSNLCLSDIVFSSEMEIVCKETAHFHSGHAKRCIGYVTWLLRWKFFSRLMSTDHSQPAANLKAIWPMMC